MERVYTTPLIDKLGIRAGARVAIAAVDDPEFRRLLAERTDDVTELGDDDEPMPDTDVVMFGADSIDELARLASLQRPLRQNGAIWVVSRKGKTATLRDVDVIDASKSVGLVDNKVASFSATHTALRLVIPVARRPR
jgi:Protein of unknown function (DUF3052)